MLRKLPNISQGSVATRIQLNGPSCISEYKSAFGYSDGIVPISHVEVIVGLGREMWHAAQNFLSVYSTEAAQLFLVGVAVFVHKII